MQMKIKPLSLAFTLLLANTAVNSATYDFESDSPAITEEQNLLPFENQLDNSFFNQELPAQQAQEHFRQVYIEIVKLIQQNKLIQAEVKLDKVQEQSPNSPAFHNLRALLETKRNNSDGAIRSFQKSLELSPNNIKSNLGLGVIYLQLEKNAKAKSFADKALSIDDTSLHAHFLLAQIALKEKKIEQAEKHLLNAQQKNKGDIKKEITVANNLVKLYASQKQQDKIINLAEDLAKRYPGNSMALSFLAMAQISLKQADSAINTLDKIVAQEKNDIRHRLILAQFLLTQGNNEDKVLQLVTEAADIAPNNPKVIFQQVAYLTKLKKLDAARKAIKKLDKLAPNSGLPEALEGDIFLKDQNYDKAVKLYKQSYKKKPNVKVLNILVNLLLKQDQLDQAVRFLDKEVKQNPKNLAAHFKLAGIYERQNKPKKIERHYKAILVEQPDNPVILNNLAWLYYTEGNPKALGLAEKAYRKAPKSAAIIDTYGTILVQQGRIPEGITILKQAIDLMPEMYDFQYHLANAYVLHGEPQLAKEILQKITQQDKQFNEKEDAIKLLEKL